MIKKELVLIISFLRAQNEKFQCMEPEPPGAGADPIWLEPESAPGPRTSETGAAQKVAAPQHWKQQRLEIAKVRNTVPVAKIINIQYYKLLRLRLNQIRDNYEFRFIYNHGFSKQFYFSL